MATSHAAIAKCAAVREQQLGTECSAPSDKTTKEIECQSFFNEPDASQHLEFDNMLTTVKPKLIVSGQMLVDFRVAQLVPLPIGKIKVFTVKRNADAYADVFQPTFSSLASDRAQPITARIAKAETPLLAATIHMCRRDATC